jgi:hypothetical protein
MYLTVFEQHRYKPQSPNNIHTDYISLIHGSAHSLELYSDAAKLRVDLIYGDFTLGLGTTAVPSLHRLYFQGNDIILPAIGHRVRVTPPNAATSVMLAPKMRKRRGICTFV